MADITKEVEKDIEDSKQPQNQKNINLKLDTDGYYIGSFCTYDESEGYTSYEKHSKIYQHSRNMQTHF